MKLREPMHSPASPDPAVKTFVNGELRQDRNRGEMICNCFEPIAHPYRTLTQEPDAYVARDPHGEATWAR
jgi:hypothetical protein